MLNLISRYKTCKSKIINNNIKSGNKNEILKKEKKMHLCINNIHLLFFAFYLFLVLIDYQRRRILYALKFYC